MRLTLSILAVALVATSLTPASQATPQCNTFTQSRTISGITTTVTTSSCYDSYVDPGGTYGYQWWQNITTLTVVNSTGAGIAVTDYGYWGHNWYTGSYDQESWDHSYSVVAGDVAGDYTQVGAGEYQSSGTSGTTPFCYGSGSAGDYTGLRTGTSESVGVSQSWGQGTPLSCTDRSVQEALP
jgi:hypothetical protein